MYVVLTYILYYLGGIGLDQGLLDCNHFNGLIRFQKKKYHENQINTSIFEQKEIRQKSFNSI